MKIYKHTSKTSGKAYVGFTSKSINERFCQHIKSAENNTDTNSHFQRAIQKYGPSDFISEKLEDVDENNWQDREKYWISYYDTLKNGYNMTAGGEGGNTRESYTQSEYSEWKKKLSISGKGTNKNTVNVYGPGNKIIKISVFHPKYLSGEWKHINTGIEREIKKYTVYDILTGENKQITSESSARKYICHNKEIYIINSEMYFRDEIIKHTTGIYGAFQLMQKYIVTKEMATVSVGAGCKLYGTSKNLKICLNKDLTVDFVYRYDVIKEKNVKIERVLTTQKRFISKSAKLFWKCEITNQLLRKEDIDALNISRYNANKYYTQLSKEEYIKEYRKI